MSAGTAEGDGRRWYVLNYIRSAGQRPVEEEVDDYNRDGARLELFAPVIRPAHMAAGKVVYRDRLLTYHYVFVKGMQPDIKALCGRPSNGLSMLLDRGSEGRYAVVGNAEMESFRIIARACANEIPFYDIADTDLEEGDLVEVVDGRFSGLRGRYIPRPRSHHGRIVVAATAALGAVIWEVDARYVRVLEFAPGTRRAYDIIDSFIPQLYPILRRHHSGERLSERDRTRLSIFARRMGVVVPGSHKAEAKLAAILTCVYTILGDRAGRESSAARYARRRGAITNPWTAALAALLIAVSGSDLREHSASGNDLREHSASGNDLREHSASGGNLREHSASGGNLREHSASGNNLRELGAHHAAITAIPGPHTAAQTLLLAEYAHYLPRQ